MKIIVTFYPLNTRLVNISKRKTINSFGLLIIVILFLAWRYVGT